MNWGRQLGRLLIALRDAERSGSPIDGVVEQLLELAHDGDTGGHQRLREYLYLDYNAQSHDFVRRRDEETAQRYAGIPYEDYLRTGAWQTRRLGARERAGGRCQLCNGTERLQVHHRTYERLGAESEGDLTVLCGDCHELFHASKELAREGA